MAKQRHDIGYRKRLDREQPRIHNNRPSSPEALARSLVRRGLAHPVILNGGRTPRKTTWDGAHGDPKHTPEKA